jgi:hypothetical protein
MSHTNGVEMSKKEFKDALKEEKEMQKCLKNKNLLVNIIKEIHKEGVVGEEDSMLALIIKFMLRLVPDAIPTSSNILISDKSGGGKDHLVGQMSKVLLENERTYFHRSGVSEKALRYWGMKKGKITKWWKELGASWDEKVLHIEDPDDELINSQVFKVVCSGESKAAIADIEGTQQIHIRGKPILIVTSLETAIKRESVRRWDSIRIDTSKELTRAIVRYNMKLNEGKIKYNPNYRLRMALNRIIPRKVNISFASELTPIFGDTLEVRTQHHKLCDYIKASAVLHQFQRKTDDKNQIIATWFDFVYAMYVYLKFGNILGVPLNVDEEEVIFALARHGKPMKISELLSMIKRGSTWIYDHIDQWKANNIIIEHYILDEKTNREIKYLELHSDIKTRIVTNPNLTFRDNTVFFRKNETIDLLFKKVDDIGGFKQFQNIIKTLNKIRESEKLKPIAMCAYAYTDETKNGKIEQKLIGEPEINILQHDTMKQIAEAIKDGFKYEELCNTFGQTIIEKLKHDGRIIYNDDGGYEFI